MAPPAAARQAHVVLVPNAGMGHLVPFTRLAALLSSAATDLAVSFVSVRPTVSDAESSLLDSLFSTLPSVSTIDLHLDSPADLSAADPFFPRYEAIRRSAGLALSPVIAAADPPVTALIADFAVASSVVPVARQLGIPCYVLFTSSAKMLALVAHLPSTHRAAAGDLRDGVRVPGFADGEFPAASIPRPLRNPKHVFTNLILQNSKALPMADGIIVNTFHFLEKDALAALNGGEVAPSLPPVIAVGPLAPVPTEKTTMSDAIRWLDSQPAKSVVYVSFGSRSAMRKDQIKQLAAGMEQSQCRFLWVLKGGKVDKDDTATVEEIVGDEGFAARVSGRGMVIKGWVEQEHVLRHPAVGCFVSHCGWNSVTEAAANGVPVLAWPRLGDQRINAGVVAASGMGLWRKEWPWDGEEGVVAAEEVAAAVKQVMESSAIGVAAASVGAEAAVAGGSSSPAFVQLLSSLAGFR